LTDGWCLILISIERKVLLAGGWFVLREKYCWLVVDKPNE
jgi:phosphomevalonate kinase